MEWWMLLLLTLNVRLNFSGDGSRAYEKYTKYGGAKFRSSGSFVNDQSTNVTPSEGCMNILMWLGPDTCKLKTTSWATLEALDRISNFGHPLKLGCGAGTQKLWFLKWELYKHSKLYDAFVDSFITLTSIPTSVYCKLGNHTVSPSRSRLHDLPWYSLYSRTWNQ